MFKKTISILEKVESRILELPGDNKTWGLFFRYILFPFKFMMLGLGDLFKPTLFWLVFMVIFVIFGTVIIGFVGPEHSVAIYNLCLYFPLGLVIFAVPSTYSFYGLKDSQIQMAVRIIESEGLVSITEIELLEENIEKIQTRIHSRVTFYKWVVGIVWAMYVLYINLILRLIDKSDLVELSETLSSEFSTFVVILFTTLVSFVLVVGYKRASEILLKSIEFGCIEKKYQVINKSNSKE